MKILKCLALMMFLLMLSYSLNFAEGLDDEGNPNDPNINPRANACFEGGSLEGRCHTDAEWNGGWYLTRFEAGLITIEQVPHSYVWILPISVLEDQGDGTFSIPSHLWAGLATGCYELGAGYYIPWNDGTGPFLRVDTYTDSSCFNIFFGPRIDYPVVARNEAEAVAACVADSTFFQGATVTFADYIVGTGANLYLCERLVH